MKLFIKGQDKEILVKLGTCIINWDELVKAEYNILCDGYIIGIYRTLKRAKQILDEIEKFIQECYAGKRFDFVYQMPEK